MPVLPLVESMMVLSQVSAPVRSPSRIIFSAGRSLTDPPGFAHSALPSISARGFSTRLASLISGVFPLRYHIEAGPQMDAPELTGGGRNPQTCGISVDQPVRRAEILTQGR